LNVAASWGFDEKRIVVSDTEAYRQFGNAVVPKVVEAVGRQIVKIISTTKHQSLVSHVEYAFGLRSWFFSTLLT